MTGSCSVRIIGFSILVVRRCDALRVNRRQWFAVVRSQRLSCGADEACLTRLLLLAPFTLPASEAVIEIACIRVADALNEFTVFDGRDVTS